MEQLFDANASAKEITRLVDGAHLMVEPDEKLACALQTLLADHHLEEVTKAIKAQGRFPLVFFDEGGGPYKAPPSMSFYETTDRFAGRYYGVSLEIPPIDCKKYK